MLYNDSRVHFDAVYPTPELIIVRAGVAREREREKVSRDVYARTDEKEIGGEGERKRERSIDNGSVVIAQGGGFVQQGRIVRVGRVILRTGAVVMDRSFCKILKQLRV